MKKNYDFKHLEKNISDMIFESLIKIGYIEEQRISVYYDEGLLCYLLGIKDMAKENWRICLASFKEYVSPRLSDLEIKRQGDRFEFSVSGDGVRYIYEHNHSRSFLKSLVEVLQDRNCVLEDILPIFEEVSSDVITEVIRHSEFQYVIYFVDKSIDEFKYCFTFDEMGHYYHRLLDYDFEKVVYCK